MNTFCYSTAFELVPMLALKIDKYFHHGSCDGNMFVAPAENDSFISFWNKNHQELTHNYCSVSRNKELLSSVDASKFSIYFYYIDDNTWTSAIWKYNSQEDDWTCCYIIDMGDL